MTSGRILITCPRRIPPFLKEELFQLGFPVLGEAAGYVETQGTLYDTMRLNLFLRTGQRVLFLINEFTASTPDELYRGISRIGWEDFINLDEYLSVSSSVDNPMITDTRFANLKCKDAIVDRFVRKYGRRPDSGPRKSHTALFLYWRGDQASMYLDTSGEPLSKRGYRKLPFKAPMQETLAAAVIQAAEWHGEGNFINPMCGSGTLAIEAALIALGRAAGLLRRNFSFMHLKGFDQKVWAELRREARLAAKKSFPGRIIATDINTEALESARRNAATAGVDHLIDFGLGDYTETQVPEGGGIIVLNPEYGERLGKVRELEGIYKGIGDFMKQKGRGYRGYVFTGNLDLAKKIGLRAKRRIPLFNGKIDCRLLEYELYEGSRRGSRVQNPAG
ncbi:MAG: THUMP domain-containing class I SAM-dependent RNA methyltransferase [bacterium]